jgi:hypothetical protein
MRIPLGFVVLSSLVLHGWAEDAAEPGEVAPVPETKPPYEVIESRTERVLREEPAPLPDMSPVQKEIGITVEQVVNPGLPDPAPAPAASAPDPEKLAAFRAMMAARPRPVFIMLSATVYDHECTLLRWHPNGRPDLEMNAWSNIDFELLAGRTRFSHNGTEYHLFLGLGREDSAARRRLAERLGRPYTPPVLPDLPPDETPGYVVTQGDATDAAATAPITALHEFFAANTALLQAEYEARLLARSEREAYLRAHPPEPKDITVRFWQRENQVARPGAATTEPTSPTTAQP